MVEPTVVARSEHSISRRDIDPDALKVLYRLHEHDYTAYLVGGSVRDLLLGRRPKDFDIGTSAHPHQVKKLFRNCWIIGRRFRLAHVKFGPKTIEVATFRRQVDPSELPADPTEADRGGRGRARDAAAPDAPFEEQVQAEGTHLAHVRAHDRLIHRDNTFGTPEEDAFRRDFTINALFYDIATFSIIDYVGGLKDLENAVDPIDRRSRRALSRGSGPDAARGGLRGAARLRHRRADPRGDRDAPPRDRARRAGAADGGVLQDPAFGLRREELPAAQGRRSCCARSRRSSTTRPARAVGFAGAARSTTAGDSTPPPDTLTNAILAGTLLAPLGLAGAPRRFSADALERRVDLGMLPIPRRDVERLHQILALQPRLLDLRAPYRAQRGLLHRHVINEALTWLEIHGGAPRSCSTGARCRPTRRRRRRRPPPTATARRAATSRFAGAAGAAAGGGSHPRDKPDGNGGAMERRAFLGTLAAPLVAGATTRAEMQQPARHAGAAQGTPEARRHARRVRAQRPFEDCCREAARLGIEGFDLICGPADWPTLKKYGLVPSMYPAGPGGTIPTRRTARRITRGSSR